MQPQSEDDSKYMARALELAALGLGRVSPNPPVGCVIVRGGQIVGEGYHTRYGAPHAEPEALKAAGGDARGATAYVTLMPCNHHGKTPPCTGALIAAGVSRVVVAADDPNPQSAGGRETLEAAGITVETGLLTEQAEWLMHGFLKFIRYGLPHLCLKYAATLDGKIATTSGDSHWISSPESRQRVQQMRARCDAVLVGSGTATSDDPSLNVREIPDAPQPLRVVADSALRLSPDCKLLHTPGGKVIILTATDAPHEQEASLRAAGAEIIRVARGEDGLDLREGLHLLAKNHGVRNVLCEGGGHLSGALIRGGVVDEVAAFICPKLLGGTGLTPAEGANIREMAQALDLKEVTYDIIGGDMLICGRT